MSDVTASETDGHNKNNLRRLYKSKIQKPSEDFQTELVSIYKQNTIWNESLSRKSH